MYATVLEQFCNSSAVNGKVLEKQQYSGKLKLERDYNGNVRRRGQRVQIEEIVIEACNRKRI